MNKLKKKGYKGLTRSRGKKPREKFERKQQKFDLNLDRLEREREKSFLKSLKKWRTREKLGLKNSLNEFWLVEN